MYSLELCCPRYFSCSWLKHTTQKIFDKQFLAVKKAIVNTWQGSGGNFTSHFSIWSMPRNQIASFKRKRRKVEAIHLEWNILFPKRRRHWISILGLKEKIVLFIWLAAIDPPGPNRIGGHYFHAWCFQGFFRTPGKSKNKLNKTDVINDPLGQTHSVFLCFARFEKWGRMDNMFENNYPNRLWLWIGRVDQKLEQKHATTLSGALWVTKFARLFSPQLLFPLFRSLQFWADLCKPIFFGCKCIVGF